ncbi:DUF4435 domain-containing protein [Francisella salimarina]|uniref:DUF4435 domain-containing protein n=1 Tax=Francisella salimarina TaxID=2599927 RepID=UPI003D81AC68
MEKIKQVCEYIELAKQLKESINNDSVDIENILSSSINKQELLGYQRNRNHYDELFKKIKDYDFDSIINDLNIIQNDYSTQEISDNYKSFVENAFISITNLNNLFIENFIDIINDNEKAISNLNVNGNLANLEIIVVNIENSIKTIKSLDILKNSNQNLVLIGANGSGKSTFSRNLKQKISASYKNNTTIVIPAQRTFFVDSSDSISLIEKAESTLRNVQKQDKLQKSTQDRSYLYSDFQNLINYLIAEHFKITSFSHENCEKQGFKKQYSTLEKTISLWQELIPHINLEFNKNTASITPKNNGKPYKFIELSDGEKSIFYCIANVLTVEKNGYIVVDEPENHLNMNIVNKLWDKLEETRPDCQFIYLTHTPNFATARNNAKIFWVKKYEAPSIWDYIEITDYNEKLPKELVVELIGSKKPILFCEGNDRTSLDYKLYSMLFTDYTVVPAGGHSQAIAYCKSFNQQENIFDNKAIAVIDKDFYSDQRINAWKKDSIYTLDVMEVENILCDICILKNIADKTHAIEEDLEKAKDNLLKTINSSKTNQAREYMNHRINEVLTGALNTAKGKEIDRVKNEITANINNKIKPEEYYNTHLTLLDNIVTSKNYEGALKYYNNKGILKFVGNKICTNYEDRVFRFIRNDKELQSKIRSKYFSEIENIKI